MKLLSSMGLPPRAGQGCDGPVESYEYEKKIKRSTKKTAKENVNDAKKRRAKPWQYKKTLVKIP